MVVVTFGSGTFAATSGLDVTTALIVGTLAAETSKFLSLRAQTPHHVITIHTIAAAIVTAVLSSSHPLATKIAASDCAIVRPNAATCSGLNDRKRVVTLWPKELY